MQVLCRRLFTLSAPAQSVAKARMGKEESNMQTKKRGRSLTATRRLVLSAVFAALAYVLTLVFRINVQFLTFDLKDAVITVAGLLLGPVSALFISVLVAVLECITVSGTGIYGLIMNIASTATLSVITAVVYKYRKNLAGAVIGLASGTVAMVCVMLLLNLLVTPYYYTAYMGIPMTVEDVQHLLPTLLLPFNAVKGLTNAALVLIFYKPISRAMAATKLLPRASGDATATERPKRPIWVSIAVTAAGIVLLVGALIFVFVVLDGQSEWLGAFRAAEPQK